jgi:hypothetical protein
MRKDELPYGEIREFQIRRNTHALPPRNPRHQTETIKRTISRLIRFIIVNVELFDDTYL